MDQNAVAETAWAWDLQGIWDNGERVSHLNRDSNYYAHLSIYDFAVQFCQDATVLDAGCGAGYGSAYLADAGARHVWAIDVSAKAIKFSQFHFQRPNLAYQVMDLEQINGFSPQYFDLIFSSNTLEHVPDALRFLRCAWGLLKPAGTLLLAVPPITDDRSLYLNLINQYHVNLWTPRQWAYVLGLFFEEIEPVLHGVGRVGGDFKPEHFTFASMLTEKSFVFERATVADMYQRLTLTALFVARRPRPEAELPPVDTMPRFVDGSFSRPQGVIDAALRKKLKKYFGMPTPPYTAQADPSNKQLAVRRAAQNTLAFLRKKLHLDGGLAVLRGPDAVSHYLLTRPFNELATREDVYYCYRLLLGRAPDPEGWKVFTAHLGNLRVQDLVQMFLRTEEFKNSRNYHETWDEAPRTGTQSS